MLELGAIDYAFNALGLPPHAAFWALIISLLGSYINIPITRIESSGGGEPSSPGVVGYFGMRYRVPAHLAAGRSTVVAINVGGAIVPLCICAWILAADPAVFLRVVVGTAIVTFIVHRAARPIAGSGNRHADVHPADRRGADGNVAERRRCPIMRTRSRISAA